MRFGLKIFVLLAILKLFSASKIDCDGNTYTNNPLLLPKLKGYLYTVYTSVAYSDNEIFNFYPIENNKIFTRTTSDPKCCKTMDVSTVIRQGRNGAKGGYYRYVITTDKNCATPLAETARAKLIASNTDDDGTSCIFLWTCRTSREGVHAFCSRTNVSDQQKKWISKQYKKLELTKVKVVHNTDYKNGRCFKKSKQ